MSSAPRTPSPAARQAAALPYRASGEVADAPIVILLVTSRETGRWLLPKGNVPAGVSPHLAAAIEAEEEAGVRGPVSPMALGAYSYLKRRRDGEIEPLDVDVFLMSVTQELTSWKEQHERDRRWFTPAEALETVDDEGLRRLLEAFATSVSRGVRPGIGQPRGGATAP